MGAVKQALDTSRCTGCNQQRWQCACPVVMRGPLPLMTQGACPDPNCWSAYPGVHGTKCQFATEHAA